MSAKRGHEDGAGSASSPAKKAAPAPRPADAMKIGSVEHFMAIYEELRDEIVEGTIPQYDLPAEAADWTREMLEYNVPGGKLNRGLTVVHTLQALRGEAPLTAAEGRSAAVLGWCIEWLQAFFLVADDVMDASVTRRGRPCWYKLPKVGMTAVNDAFLLQAHLYRFLKNHFGGSPAYLQLLELFNEVTWQTELGQLLDLTSQGPPGSGAALDLARFTLTRYKRIVKYKTAYYSFYLPVACGMILGGVASPSTLSQAEAILVQMGEYFQVQDDYLDAYASAEKLGKVGTDIQDAKCSWLVVQALEHATPAQKATLTAHYGQHAEASVAAVKALYREMDLEARFKAYEDESHATLVKRIAEATSTGTVPAAVYKSLLDKIYRREK